MHILYSYHRVLLVFAANTQFSFTEHWWFSFPGKRIKNLMFSNHVIICTCYWDSCMNMFVISYIKLDTSANWVFLVWLHNQNNSSFCLFNKISEQSNPMTVLHLKWGTAWMLLPACGYNSIKWGCSAGLQCFQFCSFKIS